jgi:hypothetical protein
LLWMVPVRRRDGTYFSTKLKVAYTLAVTVPLATTIIIASFAETGAPWPLLTLPLAFPILLVIAGVDVAQHWRS